MTCSIRAVRRPLSAGLIALACGAGAACSTPPEDHAIALTERLSVLYEDAPGPIHHFAAEAELDGDPHPEWIVHVAGPGVCGTGGCDTLIFDEDATGLRLVATIHVTRPPIAVAATSAHGWRDLLVHVSGGGILPGYDARLRFDGKGYPINPTVAPAERLERRTESEIAIPRFRSFREGVPVYGAAHAPGVPNAQPDQL